MRRMGKAGGGCGLGSRSRFGGVLWAGRGQGNPLRGEARSLGALQTDLLLCLRVNVLGPGA